MADADFLRAFASGERQLPLPAQLTVVLDGASHNIAVDAVLRLLPKKRIVVRGVLNGRPVVIKLFAAKRGGERNVRRELSGYQLVVEAGLDTPELIGQCVAQDGAYTGLVYALVAPAFSLAQCWDQFSVEEKKRWLEKVVYSALALHRAGGYQEDIHLGNFLLREDKLYILDLGSMVREGSGKPLRPARCLANLGQLIAQFPVAEQSLPDGAIDGYFTQSQWVDRKAAREKLQEYTRRAWRARLRDYLRKAKRVCSLTCFEQGLDFLWACRREWWGDDAQRFMRDPDAYMEQGQLLKAGNTATVVRATMNGQAVVIKRYNIKNRRHALSRSMRNTRAWHSWKYAHLLELIGIPSLKPVALFERRWGPFRGKAYFISECIEAPDLLSIGRQRPLSTLELESLKSILLRMETCRLSHGDFKANNLLVAPSGIAVIDLDAMRRHYEPRGFWRSFRRDLARLQRNWVEGEPAFDQIYSLTAEISALQQQASRLYL